MDFFEIEKLSEMDGKDGKPAYVVYNNNVYDVSGSKLWVNGIHMRRHRAGGDLTASLPKAPHGPEVLERHPQVGVIQVVKTSTPEPGTVHTLTLFDRVPFLRRHPHPMVVHFPIALLIAASLFYFLYLVTGNSSLETTSWHCLIIGLVSIPFGIGTGYLTWAINYESKPIRAVRIKIAFSWGVLIVCTGICVWRLFCPDHIFGSNGFLLYSILMLALAPLVAIIGWFGGQLTIPND